MKIHPVLAPLTAVAVVLLFVAACGGGDDGNGDQAASPTATGGGDGNDGGPTSPGDGNGGGGGDGIVGDVDACALVTTDEVSAALGETVAEGIGTSQSPFATCTWEAESGNFIDVMVYSASRDEVEAYFEISREDFEEIDGIGEAAYWAGSPFLQIEVLQGTYDVAISVGVYEPDFDARRVAIDLAGKAIDRIP